MGWGRWTGCGVPEAPRPLDVDQPGWTSTRLQGSPPGGCTPSESCVIHISRMRPQTPPWWSHQHFCRGDTLAPACSSWLSLQGCISHLPPCVYPGSRCCGLAQAQGVTGEQTAPPGGHTGRGTH